MVTIKDLVETIHETIHLGRNTGLDAEVRYKLPDGWSVEPNNEGYVFTAPPSREAETAMWSAIRFLSYKDFLMFRLRSNTGESKEYEVLSSTSSCRGFRMLFILQNISDPITD